MATYIRGVQDAVQAIRPPSSNLQFDAQLLTSRQSKYNESHQKLSKMYGTILNSGLSREDNIQARDEFFKLIDGDLQKITGIDLSKDSNKTKAGNVFQQIYQNDFLVKDMVWTKNYQQEMQRAEAFRDCIDPKECGGQYWDDGVKFMQYKREEFKNANRDESLNHGNVSYVPYNNMMEEAMLLMKDFSNEFVKETTDGKWKLTTKNGAIAVEPITMLYSKLFGNNPKYAEQFKVMAYNQRKDEIYRSVGSGEYSSVEEASVGYIEKHRDAAEKRFNEMAKSVNQDVKRLSETAAAFDEDVASGRLVKGDPLYQKGENAKLLLAESKGIQNLTEVVKSAQKNMYNQTNLNRLSESLDNIQASNIMADEIEKTAYTMAMQNQSITIDEDKYGLAEQNFKYDVSLANLKAKHDRELQYIKNKNISSEFKYNLSNAVSKYGNFKTESSNLKQNILAGMMTRYDSKAGMAESLVTTYKEANGLSPTINDLDTKPGGSNYNTDGSVKTGSFMEGLIDAVGEENSDVMKMHLDAYRLNVEEAERGKFTQYLAGIQYAQATNEDISEYVQLDVNPAFFSLEDASAITMYLKILDENSPSYKSLVKLQNDILSN